MLCDLGLAVLVVHILAMHYGKHLQICNCWCYCRCQAMWKML